MAKDICIFEDEGFKNLLPLCYLRPVFELRCGINSLREKLVRLYPGATVHLLCRDYLADTIREKLGTFSVNDLKAIRGDCLFINGRALVKGDFQRRVPLDGPEEIGLKGGTLIYARLTSKTIAEVLKKADGLRKATIDMFMKKMKSAEMEVDLISYPWDLVKYNSESIKEDCKAIGTGKVKGFLDESATVYGDRSRLYIGEDSRVEAGVVLNLMEGPIYIGRGAKVRPPTLIDGPSFVGDEAIIDGAKLREGSSIGRVCRIGGEVEESIFQAYSNKHHDGFLGHAYVGEWVNIGAMATNSDLKNNYGEVKVYVNGELRNSGEIKIGCFIADHAKLGIGTLLNTGTVIGVAANIFGMGLPPKYVPSFSWGGGTKFVEHDPEKAIANAGKIMARRKVEQTKAEADLLHKIYQMTVREREEAGIKKS